MAFPPIPERYATLFRDSLGQLEEFLAGMVKAFSAEWHGHFGIMPLNGSRTTHRMFIPGPGLDRARHAAFCHYVRVELDRDKLCINCDARVAEQVAANGVSDDYWCDWGLRDIAVPVMLHGFCVGIIFGGQKRLQGKEDLEGLAKMRDFARDQGLEDRIEVLTEKRNLAPAVSREEIDRMKSFLWSTSRNISRILYSQLAPQSAELLRINRRKVFALLRRLSKLAWTSNRKRFWDDHYYVLKDLADLFDCRGIAVCHTEDRKTTMVSWYPKSFMSRDDRPFAEEELITHDVPAEDGPMRRPVRFDSEMPQCPLCRKVMSSHRGIDMILYDKSKLGDREDQALHFLVFFDADLEHKHNLRFQQKAIILDQVVRSTNSVFWILQRTDELRAEQSAKDRFLKDVAHQINQPIHSLVGYCDNLVSDKISQEAKRLLPKRIRESAFHCSILSRSVELLARGVKDFSSPENLSPSACPLTRMLKEFLINVEGYGEERKVKVLIEERSTEPFGEVWVDKGKLIIAMTNVLFNAVKYSHPVTEVSVSAIHDHKTGTLVILVRNTGIEIPGDMWEKIFDRGVRTPLARKHSYSGLGIGLFVTRGIMKAMGGNAFVSKSDAIDVTGDLRNRRFENIISLALPEGVILGKGDRKK